MPASSRRFPRTSRSAVTHSVAPLISGDMTSNKYSPLGTSTDAASIIDTPIAPKHFPFPNTPLDSDIVFEAFMFCFTLVGTALQFLHIYRSVWWLPYSYNTQTVNFYLINEHLFVIIVLVLSRRLLYVVGYTILEYFLPQDLLKIGIVCHRIFLFKLLMTSIIWCTYQIMLSNHIVCLFYLCYPVFIYLVLFGFTLMPLFEFVNGSHVGLPALHACYTNPADIRMEVENLKNDFNMRMKQIMFNSVVAAYYAGLLPCCFVQNFVYYDISWAGQHVVFLWTSCFVAYVVQVLPLRYCDILHRSALHLGSWRKFETRPHLPIVHIWQGNILWPNSASVRHGKDIYKSIGEANAAEPGNATSIRFYNVFINPSSLLGGLYFLHIFVIVIQIILLFNCYSYWHYIISIAIFLCFNYYILYRVGRDYFISKRIYEIEKQIHEKGSSMH